MARSFQYREFHSFLELKVGEEWQSEPQLAMSGIADNSYDPSSTIRLLGESEHKAYKCYQVTHETVRPWKVRFHDEVRQKVITIEEFHLFLAHDGSHLLGDTNDHVMDELLKRVQTSHPEVRVAKRSVNLTTLRQQQAPRIRGGWFGKLQIADVSSAAIFGPSVSESSDWERYESSGEISALRLEAVFEGDKTTVLVTRSSGVVLYSTYSENDALELVRVINDMVGPFSEVVKDW